MPQISYFLGVIIRMFYRDHNPLIFMQYMLIMKASLILKKMKLSVGFLPPRVLGLVTEWTALHQNELMDNWERARQQESLKDIAPLV